MTEKEIFEHIVSQYKWWAGLRTQNGNPHDASSATKLKKRFYNGTLSPEKLKQIFNKHGWIKPEVQWCRVEEMVLSGSGVNSKQHNNEK